MIDLAALVRWVNAELVLHFVDGHVVRGKLIAVDASSQPEILYDVLEVIRVGPDKCANVKPGVTASADPRELSGFFPVT